MHPLAALARKAVEVYVRTRAVVPPPSKPTPEMAGRAGVFVSLKKRGGLRGCIGTFLPVTGSVAEETIRNAIAAATQDPRFEAVTAGELDELTYSVDVLSPPEKVGGVEDLDPKKYGVIVSHGSRKGLLLPDLEGVDTVEEQVRIARMKAGLRPDEQADLFRFRVDRYS
ncbi:MAG: AmmeMemoRadiSam system protein A [Thermodesulfovibrionales bacterium]